MAEFSTKVVLILGSEGHIGKALLNRLIEQVVFHLAGEVGRENCEQMPDLTLESNLIGTLNVLQCCERHIHSKLIYAGTSESYGDYYNGEQVTEVNQEPKRFNNIYGLSKWYAERLIRHYSYKYSIPSVIVRYFMCYGPGEYPTRFRSFMSRMIDDALHDRTITVHANTSRSWCYIDDIVSGTIAASEYDKLELFNIGNGKKQLQTEVIAKSIIKQTNSNSKLLIIDSPPNVYQHKHASFEKTRELLKWEAEIDIIEGIKRTIEWQRSVMS
jgi:nucleoside-diphosphate-sugar epimerase